MRKSQKRFIMDVNRIQSTEFVSFCRNTEICFVRNRKMPLSDLLFTMINRKGLTLTLELRNYMKISHPGTEISKPGYLKQRMKLNPDAFLDLISYVVLNIPVLKFPFLDGRFSYNFEVPK